MPNSLHNLHLIINLLVQHAVLDKPLLVQLLGRIRVAIEFGGDLVYHCEGTLAYGAHLVVLTSAVPFSS